MAQKYTRLTQSIFSDILMLAFSTTPSSTSGKWIHRALMTPATSLTIEWERAHICQSIHLQDNANAIASVGVQAIYSDECRQ